MPVSACFTKGSQDKQHTWSEHMQGTDFVRSPAHTSAWEKTQFCQAVAYQAVERTNAAETKLPTH